MGERGIARPLQGGAGDRRVVVTTDRERDASADQTCDQYGSAYEQCVAACHGVPSIMCCPGAGLEADDVESRSRHLSAR